MDAPLYTQASALAEANAVALSLANPLAEPATVAKVRLFTDAIVPTVITTKAELEAAEIAFTGYPVGGYEIEEFNSAILASGGGAVIYSPTIPVAYASGAAAVCGGYWLEDSAGDVREVFIYSPTRNLAGVGDGWPIVITLGYGRNA